MKRILAVLLSTIFLFSLSFSVSAENVNEEDGLVAKYDFDSDSGTTVKDSAGNYNGTAKGTTLVTGWDGNGKARSFNGASDYIQFSNKIIPNGKKSISFKIKVNSLTNSSYPTIFDQRGWGNGKGTGWIGLISKGQIYISFYENSNVKFDLTFKPTIGKYHNVLFTYDNKIGKLYVDNMNIPISQKEADNIDSGKTSSVNLSIGRDAQGFNHFSGQIDDFAVYNNAIIPDKIAETITLDKNNIELFEGNSDKLVATVLPENSNNKVIWTSSDESIATVNQDGNITAIREGVITVTAQVENTVLTADCVVTVKKQGSTELESITLDKNTLELLEGSQDKITATVTPDTAKVVWSSNNESIATVDQNGNVTAISEGQAIITATIENTDISASSTVIVKKPDNAFSSAILSITLVNGITKEYDVTNAVLNNYLNWFDSAQGTSTFKFSKTISPYKKVTEYVVHDKIASFEVREY